MKTKLLYVLVCLGAIFIWFASCGVWMLPAILFDEPWRGASAMESEFQDNKASILVVRDYLVALGYKYDTTSIRISRSWGDGPHEVWLGLPPYSRTPSRIPIEDEIVLSSLDLLFSNRFGWIGRRSNYIYFQRWSNRNQGRGALYLIDGQAPHVEPPGVITTEPLSEPGWYYYISR